MLKTARSVLELPAAYEAWWTLIGGPMWANILVREFIRPRTDSRILEIGCGPGNIARYLSEYDYVGFDLNPRYIELARQRVPRAKFVCERVSAFSLEDAHAFDVVLAIGILHHLDDSEALQLFEIARSALRPGGKLITFDGVWTNDQSLSARWIISKDRGRFVRDERGYKTLAASAFGTIKSTVRHDLLRIPYTHLILECYQ